MKLNLECGSDLRNGYVNINSSPINVSEDMTEEVVLAQSGNLDPVIPEDGSIEEILFNKPLNVLMPTDILNYMVHWSNKLQKDGVLKLSFFDVKRIGYMAYAGLMPLADIHSVLLGNSNEIKSVLDKENMFKALKECGLKLTSFSPNSFVINIEATKL